MKLGCLVLFLFLLVSGTVWGQSALVIPLSPSDAQKAKDLYAQKEKIDLEISQLQTTIQKNYLVKQGSVFIPGWGPDFEFSTDFKFIVPKFRSQGTAACFNSGVSCFNSGVSCLNPVDGWITY